jgi:hypothetical protein
VHTTSREEEAPHQEPLVLCTRVQDSRDDEEGKDEVLELKDDA